MDDHALAQELDSFDFSLCHPVREQLLQELLSMHRRDNNARRKKWQGRMNEEELDWAMAAGNPALQKQEDTQGSKRTWEE